MKSLLDEYEYIFKIVLGGFGRGLGTGGHGSTTCV